MTSRWKHQLCERDYYDSPHGVDPVGRARIPIQMSDAPAGACCSCGTPCLTSIFVREDPDILPCRGRHEEYPTWGRIDAEDYLRRT